MKQITPCLWFDNQAEEAAKMYVSIFPNSKMGTISRYSKEGAAASGQQEGSAMTVMFTLNGQEYMGLNGGPMFKFSEAVSFVVNCENQKEVDQYWEKLTEGGKESQCGWLIDKFGLSWQIVPTALARLMSGNKASQVMGALLQMKKIDIAALERAAEGK